MHAAVDPGCNENVHRICEHPNCGRVLVATEVMALWRRSGDGRTLRTLRGLSLALAPRALIMVCQPMPPPEPSRVFISYARKDGATLAQRLQNDLNEKGFDAWLDTQRIAGGAVWTDEIEVALDQAEYVVALLTQGSYVSEICRAEQLRALRKHKCVIPLMSQSGADVPLHL